jgi:predicted nucleic acid-binding protein
MARFFFDTSALVKHYHAEAGTSTVDRIIGTSAVELFIARVTLVETISVFAIKVRTGAFDPPEFARLRGLFATHVARQRYQVVRLLNVHYDLAQDIVTSYGLTRQVRTLDVLQLAVALHLHRIAPLEHFVCADQRLCAIAALEGLNVLNPELLG